LWCGLMKYGQKCECGGVMDYSDSVTYTESHAHGRTWQEPNEHGCELAPVSSATNFLPESASNSDAGTLSIVAIFHQPKKEPAAFKQLRQVR